MKQWLLHLLLILCSIITSAQTPVSQKKFPAQRTSSSPKIDGHLTDSEWKNLPIATDFVENNPTPGKVETKNKRTEVKMLYDDDAIYIAARMYANTDSIAKELMTRDQIGNTDYFGILFDPFLDRMNGNGFYVTASGTQFDAKYTADGDEDSNWNAVWESEVNIDSLGWTLEMKIPYSALRFSNKEIQHWGLNMIRKRALENAQTFWNFVDPKVNGLMNQAGTWEGLTHIKAPLRLSFSPYISTFISHFPNNVPRLKDLNTSINGGMDLKYGINNSFTLDMTLIPDFGQVQSDNRILNLTPFEVRFDENRSFFTEGTELFNKGDLFYSRRIGASPAYFKNLNEEIKEGETLIENPQESKVLNATKISGRTAKGLGIGLFNAITNKMFMVIEDATGHKREIENQPLTNYNVFVLDQSLKNNSSVTFINTNVLRKGSAADANVTAFLFNLNDKNNKYFIKGGGKMSYLTGSELQENQSGYYYEAEAGKQSGTFTWSYQQKFADRKFDPSDLGFFTNNNFFDQTGILHYNIYKPGKWYNTILSFLGVNYSRRFKPSAYQNLNVELGPYVQFKNLWSAEVILNWRKAGNDFYESRNGGLYQTPESYGARLYVNPNRAKAYNFGGNIGITKQELFNGRIYNFYLFQNLRLNDKFSVGLDLYYEPSHNFVGWAGFNHERTVFSRYDRNTVENSFDAKYSFSNKMGINLRARHYWSDRRNREFYHISETGTLTDYTEAPLLGADRNYNVFNIDLIYTWQFAPGSEISITYKDISENSTTTYLKRYTTNLDRILAGPHQNSLSVKMLYYIDYLDLRRNKKAKTTFIQPKRQFETQQLPPVVVQ